jgi:hypothetical protein
MLPILVFWLFALAAFLLDANLYARTTLKKVRMGIQSSFLLIFFLILFPAFARRREAQIQR